MDTRAPCAGLTRRDLLGKGAAALGAGAVLAVASAASAQAVKPRRGGVFRVSALVDPFGFDPHQTVSWWTQISLSFTHSRLVRHRAGPDVRPGTFPIEADLAESWAHPNPTTWVFQLRRGVRWHPKPPMNGRELTAQDVKYTYERFLAIKGNPHRVALEDVARIEAADRYTVVFTLRESFAWFLDALASTTAWIVPREAVERFGDLKRPEACIGTGPWMLERHAPSVGSTFVRNPHYFQAGLPYADGVELILDPDPSSRLAGWLGGKYDFAPGFGMVVSRLDLDVVRPRKPGLQSVEFPSLNTGVVAMRLGREPLTDVRVRRALALAVNRRELLEASPVALGHGVPSPAVPPALTEWAIPLDQLTPEGRRLYEQDLPGARRLLAEAGYPSGFRTVVETTAGFGPDWMDGVQVYLRNWKAAGVETDLRLKEHGAFLSSTIFGKFEKLMLAVRGGALYPDRYLADRHLPGEPLNSSGVDDPRVTELIRLQRRTFDPAKRREILYDLQRHLAERVYYIYGPAARAVCAWEPWVRNFGPNLGNDYGGRLVAAWLDR